MKKRYLGIFAIVALLCIALAGCGAKEDYTANFAGSWQLVAMQSTDSEVSEQDIQGMKDLGLTVDLSLAEDGTCSLVMFGEDYGSGTWEATSASAGEMTMKDQTIGLTLDSSTGRLSMVQGDESLIFERA